MKDKISPFIENIAESTGACLVTMVQGNLMALTLGHWLIASQTGLVAGTVSSAALLLARTKKRWVIALTLGGVTAFVDFLIHPGMFGPVILEAIVTGVGAAFLSLLVGAFIRLRAIRTTTYRGARSEP